MGQQETIISLEWLLAPNRRIDTSFSVIFLKGDRAYKIKREVKTPFLDYSTIEKRGRLCKREFEINSRHSPELYRGVMTVRCGNGSIGLLRSDDTPTEEAAEYLLEMNRFDEEQLLSRLAARGLLTEELCGAVAAKVARMHGAAPVVESTGYAEKFLQIVNIIIAQFRAAAGGMAPEDALDEIPRKLQSAFDNCRGVLSARGSAGTVRECHGDLHLGNICLYKGAPCIFDAVEFNTEFTHIDTLYDLSFLIMDLHHHGLPKLAERVSAGYLAGTNTPLADYAAVMQLYLGLRAVIRCSISAGSAVGSQSPESAAALRREALRYLEEARTFLS